MLDFFVGFFASCLEQPMLINEHVEDCSFDAFLAGGEETKRLQRLTYKSQRVLSNLKKLIPFFDENGAFDF